MTIHLECVCKVLFGSVKHVALEEGKGVTHNLHIYKHTGPALERRLIEAQERVCLPWAVALAGEPGCRGACRLPGSVLKWEME